MKRVILSLLIVLLVLLCGVVQGNEMIGILDQVYRPQSLIVTGGKVLVAQESAFLVFQLADLRPLQPFGREGEGPGEMKSLPFMPNTLMETGDFLLGESMNKIIGFSKGDFGVVTEKKKGKLAWNFMPLGENFVYSEFSPNNGDRVDIKLVLVDGDLRVVKVLHRQSTLDRDKEIIMLRDTIVYGVMNDRLYVEKSDQAFVIDVYDQRGDRVRRIEHPGFNRVTVTDRMKEAQMEFLKSDTVIGMIVKRNGGWENFKKMTTFTFPRQLPVIRDLLVKDDTIFALTYTSTERIGRLVQMDEEGAVLKQCRVPFTPSPFFTANALGKIIRFWDVYRDYYYYLDFIEEDDAWLLKRVRL